MAETTAKRPLLVLNLDYEAQQVVEINGEPTLRLFELDPDWMADQPQGFIVFEGKIYDVQAMSQEEREEANIPSGYDYWYEGPWRQATAADLEAWGLIASPAATPEPRR